MNLEAKLAKSLELSDLYSPKDILGAIKDGKMQAWTQEDTLIVTKISVFPRKKVCESVVAAGNLDNFWSIHDEQIVPFAKRNGCDRITGAGRLGWAKEAQKHGYTREWALVSMEI